MYSLRFLGGVSFEGPSGPVTGRPAQKRELALLAILAAASQGVTKDKLVGCLWPDSDEGTARRLLSNALYVLRKEMGEEFVHTAGDTVRLEPQIIWSDVGAFQEALAAGDLEAGVAVYAGPFLDGFYADAGRPFETWLDAERRRLALLHTEALESLGERAEAAKEYAIAAGWWQRLVANDPYNSRYVLRLMQAMVAAGDPANAIQQAEEHARVLRQDLGMEPPRDLVRFADQLREAPIPREESEEDHDMAGRALGTPPLDFTATDETLAQRPQLISRRSLGLAVLAAVVLCGAIAVLWIFLPREGPRVTSERVPGHPANRLAILPFSYHGSEEFAYLGETLDELLTATLDGVGDLRTVPSHNVLAIVGETSSADLDPQLGGRVAESLEAGRHIIGHVVEVEGRLRIDAWLHSSGGARDDVVAVTAEGDAGDFYTLVDDLTRQLVLVLVGSLKNHEQLAVRTTDSLSALKYYLEGVGHHRALRLDSAVAAFRRAVEIDSTFALAWYGIAEASMWPGMPEYDAGVEAGERALRLSERLPPRARGLISAGEAYDHGDALEAERLYRELLGRYPRDAELWFYLGLTLSSFGEYYGRPESEAFERYKRALRYNPSLRHYQYVGIWVAAMEGDWATFDSLTSVYFGEDGHFGWRAVRAFGAGDEGDQRQIIEVARDRGDVVPLRVANLLAQTVHDVTNAAKLARLAVLDSVDPEPRAILHLWAAGFELAAGRWSAAQAHLAHVAVVRPYWATLYRALWAASPSTPVTDAELRALRDSIAAWDAETVVPSVTSTQARAHDVLSPQLRLYALGRLSWRLGDREATLRHAADLEALGNPPEAFTYAVDRALSLRAHVLYEEGRHEEALATLESQPRRLRPQYVWETMFYPHPEDRFLRGEILSRLGRLEEALRWYTVIGDVQPFFDYHYVGMAYFRRGEVHARLGRDEMAIVQFQRVVELWRDCDPELQPLVQQTRQALERLTS